MAVSLAFGILFSTAITLLLIPCAYIVNEDLKRHVLRAWRWYYKPFRVEVADRTAEPASSSPPSTPPLPK
jgi:hypothetical protein